MPSVDESLALAASSNKHSREKRLSAILGTVLLAHTGFANTLLNKLDLPRVDELDVWREEALGQSGQIDLILRGTAEDGQRSIVYFENKEPGGKWQDGQPWKYLGALSSEIEAGGDGKLLVLVGEPEDVRDRVRRRVGAKSETIRAADAISELRSEADHPQLTYATWHQVGGWVFEAGELVGAGIDSADWLELAAKPDSRADQRLLAELIWYLEEEGYAMARGLRSDQIRTARGAFRLVELLERLEEDVATRIDEANLGLTPLRGKPTEFYPPSHSWLPSDARISVYFYPPTTHKEIDLAFYVDAEVGSQAKALDRSDAWKAKLSGDLEFDGESILARFDTKLLVERSTLPDQGEVLATWAIERLRKILEFRP